MTDLIISTEKQLEDIINNVSTLHLSGLVRAAKVSPSIKDGRTLGPIETTGTQNITKEVTNIPLKSKDSRNHRKAIEYNENKLYPNFNLPIKNDLLDLNIINTSVAAKICEKTRKENVKKELEQRLSILSEENKRRQEILVKSIITQNTWIQNKIENDKKIYQIAEKYVEEEIKQSNKNTEKILNEKQRRLQAISLEAIVERRKIFTSHYEKVCQLLKSEKNSIDCEEYNKNLKVLVIDFESLIQKIKNNNMGQSEILVSESLCDRIRSLYKKLADDINTNKIKLIQHSQQQQQIVQQPDQTLQISLKDELHSQQIQNQSLSKINDTTDSAEISNRYVSYETLNFYSEIITFYNEKLQLLSTIENDPNMKKFLAACRRNINIPVAAICAVSPQHMQDKFDKILNFISGNTKKQSASDVHVSEHLLAKDYCIRYLAKKFIAVAGTEISSNAQAAFAFASIIIAIWNRIPEFGKLLLGQMYTESIFLVPLLFSKTNFQNDIEYKIAFGYNIIDNALEEFSTYNKRQTGIVRLFAAIMISHGRHDDQNHPFPIENGWKWLCNLINIKPEMHDICATVIVEFLQISGYEMLTLYGKQFKKLLLIIQEQYLLTLNQIEDGKAASKGKLEQTLDLILKYNRIDKPPGMLSKNFW